MSSKDNKATGHQCRKDKLVLGHRVRLRGLEECQWFRKKTGVLALPEVDCNTMDVDMVRLKKLTPQECAKCMKEGRCFKCRKVGHDAKNCRTKYDTTSNPPRLLQQILHTEATPVLTSPTKSDPSPFATYAQSLGKSEEELLQTLKLCYEEADEEVRAAETFEELQDF